MDKIKTEEDLQMLIDTNTPEDVHLDYKEILAGTDKEKEEIAKDVSAFANSDGGTLIYGIKEDKQNNSFSLIGIQNDKIGKTSVKEWIEQVIDSKITPKISGVEINIIQLQSKNFAVVIFVPQSPEAPHQSGDKKYYKRSNSKNVPMEHYEVNDVRNRSFIIPSLVNIDTEIYKGCLVNFIIENNNTQWSASDIKFTLSEDFDKDWRNKIYPPIFETGLSNLPPNKRHKFVYEDYNQITDSLKKEINITVSYFHPQIQKDKVEIFTFCLEYYKNTVIEKSEIDELREMLNKQFSLINDSLKKISGNLSLIAQNTELLSREKVALLSYFRKGDDSQFLLEYDNRVIDVINASYNTFEEKLSSFLYFINNDKNISHCLSVLPTVDFDTWYCEMEKTRSGMVGSGQLKFPENKLEKLSLLKKLFETKKYKELYFSFMYKSGNLNDCVGIVVTQLFIPFARDLRLLLTQQ